MTLDFANAVSEPRKRARKRGRWPLVERGLEQVQGVSGVQGARIRELAKGYKQATNLGPWQRCGHLLPDARPLTPYVMSWGHADQSCTGSGLCKLKSQSHSGHTNFPDRLSGQGGARPGGTRCADTPVLGALPDPVRAGRNHTLHRIWNTGLHACTGVRNGV